MRPQYPTTPQSRHRTTSPILDTPEDDVGLTQPPPRWWLRVASSSQQNPQRTPAEREMARRSDLVAWLALGLLGGALLLTPIAVGDLNALLALLVFAVSVLIAVALNRSGMVHSAGVLLVICIVGALLLYMLTSPLGLTMGQLPNYDAFAVAVVVAASVLPRGAPFIVAALNSIIIAVDYLLQPHNANIAADAALYPSVTQQTVSLLARPIALQFVFAVVAYLWVRGTDQAMRRADQAEEVAELERRELERTIALEEGARYLHQTLVQWMSGDFRWRVPSMPVDVLQRLSEDLNAFILQFGGQIQAGSHLQRTQEEAGRLADVLRARAEGRVVPMPPPSGTPVDQVIEALRALGLDGPTWGW
jgi:hypothetical protein